MAAQDDALSAGQHLPQRAEPSQQRLRILDLRVIHDLELEVGDELAERRRQACAVRSPGSLPARSATRSGSSVSPGPERSPVSSDGKRPVASSSTRPSRSSTEALRSAASTCARSSPRSASARRWPGREARPAPPRSAPRCPRRPRSRGARASPRRRAAAAGCFAPQPRDRGRASRRARAKGRSPSIVSTMARSIPASCPSKTGMRASRTQGSSSTLRNLRSSSLRWMPSATRRRVSSESRTTLSG